MCYVFGLCRASAKYQQRPSFSKQSPEGGGLHLPPRIWLDRYFKRNAYPPNPPRNTELHGWTSSAPLLLALTAGGADSFYLLPFQRTEEGQITFLFSFLVLQRYNIYSYYTNIWALFYVLFRPILIMK